MLLPNLRGEIVASFSLSMTKKFTEEHMVECSVVIPVYNEETNTRLLIPRLKKVMDSLKKSYEIIFIDDGSKDGTWQEICKLYHLDKRIRGFKLSRNFGHQYAIIAGFSHSRGQVVITMDADMQHPPEIIPLLLEEWRKGAKIVHTIRIDNNNIPWKKKISSRIFYKIFS